jgi:hypothetical protein
MHQLSRIPIVLMGLVTLLVLGACRGTDRAGEASRTDGVRVTDVALGRSVGGDRSITDRTETFNPNDTIYASVATDGAAENVRLRARWTFEDGQVVDESSRTISPRGQERTEFHISKPDGWPAGRYRLEVFVNDQPAETKDFQVRG